MSNEKSAWVGIDPGASKTSPGAAALICKDGFEYFDWSNEYEVSEKFRHWVSKFNIKRVGIERQWSRPTDSKQNIAKIMKNFGIWIGICCANGLTEKNIFYPTPQEWQKASIFTMRGQDPKAVYLKEARIKFPTADLKLQKHHGRAAALWIAYYTRRVDKIHGSNLNRADSRRPSAAS